MRHTAARVLCLPLAPPVEVVVGGDDALRACERDALGCKRRRGTRSL